MSITLALGHDQRVATVVTLIAVAVVAAGIVIWRRQYNNPRINVAPRAAKPRTQQPAAPAPIRARTVAAHRPPTANVAAGLALREHERPMGPMLKPSDHVRRDPFTVITNEEMSNLARFILAHYGKGTDKFTYSSTSYGVAKRAFAGFSTDFAHLLNCASMAEVPDDAESVDGFCRLLKHSKQFEQFLLNYHGLMSSLYFDYDTCLDDDIRHAFGLFEPSAWTFNYLRVAAASRDSADMVAEGVMASQLVLAVNFMLALDGIGLLALHEKCSVIVDTDDYANFIGGLDSIIEVELYREKPERLVMDLMQVFRDGPLLELFIKHIAILVRAREVFWGLAETSAEHQMLVPYVPQIETIDALTELNEQVAETK